MVQMLMRNFGLLMLLAPLPAMAQSLPGNALALGAASRAGGPSGPAQSGALRLPDAGVDPAGPLAGNRVGQQQPLSPREQQRRVERLQLEAEEAGDADAGPDRPLGGRGSGFAMHGLADAGQTDRDDSGQLNFGLSVGNTTLWAGADWVFDTP